MVTHQTFTSDFIQPRTYRRLQQEGVFITTWGARGEVVCPGTTKVGMRSLLFCRQGIIHLQDNAIWVSSQAKRYNMSVTSLNWVPEKPYGMVRSCDLFLTPFGARTLADALMMRTLSDQYRLNQSVQSPPLFDDYTNEQDSFVDRNGFSSTLD